MTAQRAIVYGLFLSWPQIANAEVMDKVPSAIELWLFSSGTLIVAVSLGLTFHPLAAFAVYPLSLFLTWMILDLLRSDLGSAIFIEAGWPFFIQSYAMGCAGYCRPSYCVFICQVTAAQLKRI